MVIIMLELPSKLVFNHDYCVDVLEREYYLM